MDAKTTPQRVIIAREFTALGEFERLWDELFPAEQARIVRLLVERVDVWTTGIDVRLRAEGLRALADELRMKEAA